MNNAEQEWPSYFRSTHYDPTFIGAVAELENRNGQLYCRICGKKLKLAKNVNRAVVHVWNDQRKIRLSFGQRRKRPRVREGLEQTR